MAKSRLVNRVVWGLGLTVAVATTAAAQTAPKALTARLSDFVEMPLTGHDARSQPARINFLVEEPGQNRLFVSDSSGPLYILDKKTHQPVVYLDFDGSGNGKGLFPRFIADFSFASGLLGFTFDPDYARNGIFYTLHLEDVASTAPAGLKGGVMAGLDTSKYTPTKGVFTPSGPAAITREAVLVEWTDKNIKDTKFEGTAREILRVQLLNGIHPTDDVTFNPTARRGDADWRVLYVSTGDGGTGELTDVRRLNPQRLDHFGGKIIRIVPDLKEHVANSEVSENGQYRIPRDNPFFATPGARKEIWAYGMRNPHRMTWDVESPRQANLLAFVIGANGGNPVRYETIDIIKRGANYGYPLREGPEFRAESPIYGPLAADKTLPLRISDTVVMNDRVPMQDSALAYKTSVEGNAIAGGFVYRGKKWPALQSCVVFGDITSGRIFYAKVADLVSATDGDPTTLAPYTEIKTDLPQIAAERAKIRVAALPPAAAPPTATPPAAGTPAAPPSAAAAAFRAARSFPPRTDMRLATDSDGEIYVMTKSDGVIRRIESIQ
ncbi:PQQ-dependent sugar dehydrogenase [Terriglobus roseus]|nr:PQQ-dependent sugar dehydrogenase [Terriglobus roseus]